MKPSLSGTSLRLATALALLALASPLFAQQQGGFAQRQSVTPAAQPAAVAQLAPAPLPIAASPAAPQPIPLLGDAGGTASENSGKSPNTATITLRELSPWSMFMSADMIVEAVMIGLAFASLVTWTIFIAKAIELSVAKRQLRVALNRITESRSLAEAQLTLGPKYNALSALLAAAMREARLSAGISSDSGIKERAASSFAEIVRAEARRIRTGMAALATIGATSPFVGLFGTVWGIMNSFIGISKSQTTNLAVVAPGIAEALLATAFGLVAAIPAVIIYNHFARVMRNYLELVGRSSGAAGRLLSRDLDRTHVGVRTRAAE
jgi:biopolymer transport protein ExbB